MKKMTKIKKEKKYILKCWIGIENEEEEQEPMTLKEAKAD